MLIDSFYEILTHCHHHSHVADEDSEDIALFNDIMGLHPNLHEFITALASKEDLDAYHTFCRMVHICATILSCIYALT